MTVEEQCTMRAVQGIAKKVNGFALRDYFAGQALAGMGEYLMQNRDSLRAVAKTCYNVADAMIEFRKEKENG